MFYGGMFVLVLGLLTYNAGPTASQEDKTNYLHRLWYFTFFFFLILFILISSLWISSKTSFFGIYPLFSSSFTNINPLLYSSPSFTNIGNSPIYFIVPHEIITRISIPFWELGILFLFLIWLCISKTELVDPKAIRYEFYVVLFFALFGMFLILYAQHFISIYLSIEFFSLAIYILIAFFRKSKLAAEAAFKYFTMSAIGTCFLLLGMTLLYGSTGLMDFSDLTLYFILLHKATEINPMIYAGLFLIYSSIFMKIGAAPFHIWLADVYEGALTIVMAFLAVLSKIPFFLLLLRMNTQWFLVAFPIIKYLVIFVSILSLYFGAVGALQQQSIKRFFAYSGINHMGYILLGISIGTKSAILFTLHYIFIYGISTLAFIGIYMTLVRQMEIVSKGTSPSHINPSLFMFSKLYSNHPYYAILISIILFSYIGLPPLAGFYAKYMLFIIAIHTKMYLIVLYASIMTTLSAIYYIRIIKSMFFHIKDTNLGNSKYEWIRPTSSNDYDDLFEVNHEQLLAIDLCVQILVLYPLIVLTLQSILYLLSVNDFSQHWHVYCRFIFQIIFLSTCIALSIYFYRSIIREHEQLEVKDLISTPITPPSNSTSISTGRPRWDGSVTGRKKSMKGK